CHSKAEYLKSKLSFAQVINDGPTFNEFAVRLPRNASKVAEAMLTRGFCAGLPLADVGAGGPDDLLVAVTERRTKEEIDEFARALEDAACN
ncbi:MAG: glycine dehydrogenase, partial [Candidatus Hydrogenedentes bacterium]|nr:glycine dehydrogenase [Candidatus Hydrogenedentota bacterium]